MSELDPWPPLAYADWKDTYATLHLWSQVVGKIALALAPPLNHSWGIALQVTPRGLTTRTLRHGARSFAIEFDLVEHRLDIRVSDGARRILPLEPQSVADFYRAVMAALDALELPVRIWPAGVELPEPVRLDTDEQHRSYDRASVDRFWRVLRTVAGVFEETRCAFIGKASPVHFFWGGFDLAVTRFSGRPAPPREGPAFMREAYSHEVISHGFWPGNEALPQTVFYAYAVPEPSGFKEASVEPRGAAYDATLGEFILPYEAVRTAADPAAALRQFVTTTYDRGAALAGWDLQALEHRSLAG
jgi:hypothetical protein